MGGGEDSSLVIRFKWQVGDLRPVKTYWIGLLRGPWKQAITILARLVSLVVIISCAAILFPDGSLTNALILAFVATNSVWVSWLISIVGFRALERASAAPEWQVGSIRVIIARDGVRWADELSETYTSWLGITDVEVLDGSIWLKTGKATGIFIPSRVLQNEADRQLVLKKISQFRAAPSAPSHLTENDSSPLVRH